MTQGQEENAEFLEQINFGDGKPEPAEAPPDPIPEPVEAAPEPDPEPSESEQRAQDIGWRPKEEWRGDPDKWVSAEKYLEKGDKLLPIMKKDREKLFKETADLRQQLKDFKDYHQQDRDRVAKREYERGLQDVKVKQRAAVEEGDTGAYEQLEQERDDLEKSYREEAEPEPVAKGKEGEAGAPAQEPETLKEWRGENAWYGTDTEATMYAQSVSNFVLQQNPTWKGDEKDFFDAVKGEVKRRYPDKFSNPRRKDTQGVEGADYVGGRGNAGKKTFADLPADAKAQCANMLKQGMKQADFVSEYFGQDAITFGD